MWFRRFRRSGGADIRVRAAGRGVRLRLSLGREAAVGCFTTGVVVVGGLSVMSGGVVE